MEKKEKEKVTDLIKKHERSANPKVSVIVPVYKVEKYLVKCIESIINQTLEEIEIIIVDEGEKDRCREIIDFYESADKRIIAPHKKNGGYGASCNLGIGMAKGEYIIIVESDDYIEKEMCEELYDYAKLLDADVVKTPYYEVYNDGYRQNCCYRNKMLNVTPQGKCFSMKEFGSMLEIHASLWSGIYKTEYMKKNNILFVAAKGGAYVDVGFRIDTLINTDKIAWLNKPYYNYRVDSEGSTTNNFKISPMIQRWKEVHERFKKNQSDYDNYYGKYLIRDEYLNTLGWLKTIKYTKQDIENLRYNYSFITEETVNKTDSLNKEQKEMILAFKQNPKEFFNKIKKEKIKYFFTYKLLNLSTKITNPWHLIIIVLLIIINNQTKNIQISTNYYSVINYFLIVMGILYIFNLILYYILRLYSHLTYICRKDEEN